jgi:tol-pal system protein YbgF
LADAPVIQGHSVAAGADGGISMGGSQVMAMPANASVLTQSPEQALVTGEESDNVQPQLSANKRDAASQIIELQQQIQDLRGQLEVQAHTIAQLQSQQTQQYQAIDSRLSQLGAAKLPPVAVVSAPATAVASDPSAIPQQEVAVATNVSATTVAAESTIATSQTANQENNEEQMYQEAYHLVATKQYGKATVALQTYLQQYPNGQYAATSHYWLGELALIAGNLPQAKSQFNTVITQFPQSPKAADSMLKLGMIYYNQSQWKQARAQFVAVSTKFPDSASAQVAQQQLKQLQRQGN